MAEVEVKVPDSLKAKESKRRGRPVKAVQTVEPEQKPAAPKVVLDSGRRRVRLRGANYALPCCVSLKKGGEIRVTLQPNRWTEVPEEIYQMLKSKFGHLQEREVPDYRGNQDDRNPERAFRMESPNAPIIEGL